MARRGFRRDRGHPSVHRSLCTGLAERLCRSIWHTSPIWFPADRPRDRSASLRGRRSRRSTRNGPVGRHQLSTGAQWLSRRDRQKPHVTARRNTCPPENLDAGCLRIRPAGLGTAMTYRVLCSTYRNGELPSAALEFHQHSAVTRIVLEEDAAAMRLPNIRPGNSLGHRVVTRIASTALGITVIRKVGPRIDPTLIRLTGGRLSSVIPFPALLLSHTGARTGVTHRTPIVYFTDAGRVIVIASNIGAPKNPAWYYNIKANPEVTLLGRGFSGSFLAEEVVGPERDRLFQFAAGALSPNVHPQPSGAAPPAPPIALRPGRGDHPAVTPPAPPVCPPLSPALPRGA